MRTGQGELANRRRSVFLSHTIAAQTDLPCRGRERARLAVLLILLLILADLRLFQTLMNAEDTFKSSSRIENKRHTGAHQPLTSRSTTTVAIPPFPP